VRGLEPVAAHHAEAQRGRAAALLAAARDGAAATLAKAEAEAAAIIEAAEHEGESSAELDTNREWVAGRRRARGMVLAARRDIYDELKRRCVEAARQDRRLGELVALVADDARRQLGPGTDVVAGKDTVTASRKGRHIRWSIEDRVDEVLGTMPEEVEALWA
jgi:hypothetical protein